MTTYVLDRTPPPPVAAPTLDASQQAVVDHPGGPLLVLAGPGTGKTTTLVEAVVERVHRGLSPEQILVLTFSRRAADELRERITLRLGRTIAEPSAWTFHSWCLAVVRAYDPAGTPRLLSGPERLVRIRELLRGHAQGAGTTRWPASVRPALDTAGLAREVADLLDRLRERGLEPHDLRALATAHRRDDWRAAADFFEEYTAVLGAAGEMDYAELIRRASQLLDDPDILADLHARYHAVFVDEYQDTDPAQERLLQLLAGGGGDLVVVGDPDQSIYAFRGADVQAILRFQDRFRTTSGQPAPVAALGVCRRFGPALLDVSRTVATRLPAVPGPAGRTHRDLRSAADVPTGEVDLRLFATVADEANAIADVLRRAHLEDGLPWGSMAVLVRSGKRSLPVLRRALVAAGVPVSVASDEVPVARDPAVGPLLLALRCAADPRALDDEAARRLLTSPLARMTPGQLRRLGRALRRADRDRRAAEDPGLALPQPSAALVRAALASPGDLLVIDERDVSVGRPVRRLADLLDRARRVLADGGTVEQALWEIWAGSGWPHRLQEASLGGGQPGRAADRDLDAVVALFDELARFEERRPYAGVASVLGELEAQEIPSESRREGTLAGAGAVRLLTAHRSKGLEWDLVVVAGVQDGLWPDVRRRASLLESDRIARDESGAPGVREPPTSRDLLVDERRLFYVAITRSRQRLVVTAVRSSDDDGERPSRFIDELGLDAPAHNERAAATLSVASVVARLRHQLLADSVSEEVKAAAARQLTRLAADGPDGRPLVRAAHPAAWWGLRDWTPGVQPVRPRDEPVRLSGSAVNAYDECPLAWFLEREAKAQRASGSAQGFGLVLHALARLVATGAIEPDIDVLMARLDEVWDSLGFDATWQRESERRAAEAALRRFLTWHRGRPGRQWIASEAGFELEVGRARLRGSIDRLERDKDGRVRVVDFKTGKNPPGNDKVRVDRQLGIYQLAVREGGLADCVGVDPVLGGAELVQLRTGTATGEPKVQSQPALDKAEDPGWADELLDRVAAGVLAEHFPARVNERCDRCPYARACPAQDEGGQVVR